MKNGRKTIGNGQADDGTPPEEPDAPFKRTIDAVCVGERALLTAILADAVRLIVRGQQVRRGRAKYSEARQATDTVHEYERARAWVLGSEGDTATTRLYYSFDQVCTYLGYDPGRMRRLLLTDDDARGRLWHDRRRNRRIVASGLLRMTNKDVRRAYERKRQRERYEAKRRGETERR